MAVLVIVVLLVLLALGARLSPLRTWTLPGKLTVARVANVVLVLTLVGFAGWLLGYVGSSGFRGPRVTFDDLAKLGPIATALTALAALIGVAVTVRQKNATDARDAWWKRSEWALDWAYGEDSNDPARKSVGLAALKYQLGSRLAKPEEAGFLLACVGEDVGKIKQALKDAGKDRKGSGGDVRLGLKEQKPDGTVEPVPEEGGVHE